MPPNRLGVKPGTPVVGPDICSLLPAKKVASLAGVVVTSSGVTSSVGVEVCDYELQAGGAYPYIRVYVYNQGAAAHYSVALATVGKAAEKVAGVGERAFADTGAGLEALSGDQLVQVWGGPGQGAGQFGADIALAKALLAVLK